MVFVLAFIVLFLPMTIFFPTKIIHKERMPKHKKCIATSNHYSNADPILLDIRFGKKFYFMAKIELFKNKFVGWFLKKLGGIPVDREKVSPSVFKETLTHLNKNHQVYIFPEGTRNKEGTEELGEIKSGIVTFASKGEAEIIPMIIYQKPKAFRKNYIIVGEPFKIEGENPKRLTKEEMDLNLARYTKVMEDLRIEIDEYVASKKRKKH